MPSYALDPETFRRYLAAKNASVRRLSDTTGISRTSIRRWVRGHRIHRSTVARLTAELEFPANLFREVHQ